MLLSRIDSRCVSFDEAVLGKVNRDIPVKLSKKPHTIEMMSVQLLVFSPW